MRTFDVDSKKMALTYCKQSSGGQRSCQTALAKQRVEVAYI